ncbi:unnamed protein product, partial [Ascophyllum nodosum]
SLFFIRSVERVRNFVNGAVFCLIYPAGSRWNLRHRGLQALDIRVTTGAKGLFNYL